MATTYPKIPAYPNILNGGAGATSIEVTSTDNSVTQNGASSFNATTKTLTVDLSADKIPAYTYFADLPDPTTVELNSYAAVNQTTQTSGSIQLAGIYNILTTGEIGGQYWNFLGEYPDNSTIKFGNEVLYVNTGTSANQIIKLDGNAKIPAVDASQTTIGIVVPTNAIVSDNDSINTSMNKLQGQIDNALKPLSPAVNNNIVGTTSTGTLKDLGFNINNSLPYSNPSSTEIADALSTYNFMISLANSSNGLQPVSLYFDTNQTLSGLPTQNGYTCVDNDRVILTNQTNSAENLIYNVHSGAWTIASDSGKVNGLLGAWTEIVKGTYSNNYTYLVNISPASGNVPPTAVTWSTPVPAGLYQAGAGLSLTGSVFSVADNGVTNAKLNTMAANTVKMNATSSTANAQDVATNTAFNKNFETSTANIKMDGIVSVGSSGNAVNSDHVHPSDTSKQNIILTPTTDDIVSVNSLGQVIDSGKAFSLDTALSANSTNKVPVESVLKYNIDYVNNRINNLPIGAGSGTVYYFTNDVINSYFTLATTPKNGTQAQLQATVNNNSVLLGAFQTTSQLNRTLIDAGIWEFNIWVTSGSTQNTTSVYAEVYKISDTNVETLLFTINNSSNIGSTSIIQYSISDTQPSYVVALTDKLIIKLYAKTTRTQNTIVTVYYNSQQYYSHAHTPLIAKHNQLSGLNGGNGADEYYHLTNSQYNNVINQASNLQNGYLSSTDWTTFNNKQNALTNPVTSSSASATNNQLAVFNGTGNQVSPQTTLPTAAVPAFIGDITNTAGSLNTTISNNAVTNAKLNTMATNTIKANITGSTANPQDITIAQLNTALSVNTNTQYVTPSGSDTNNGYTPSTGVATLAQALTNLGNVAGIIFISPKVGGYSGDYTINSQNINIVSLSANQAVDFNGTLTFSHTASNVQLNNISCEILNHTGAGALYMFGGSVTTSLTSSGNGYLYTSGVDLQATATTVSITGAKSVVFTNATALGQLTINNASAIVSLLNCLNSKAITLTSGIIGINNSTVYSPAIGTNALTAGGGAIVYATNSTFLVTGTNSNALLNIPAGSFYSLNNCQYSPASVISGTQLTRVAIFDSLKIHSGLNLNNSAITNASWNGSAITNSYLSTMAANTIKGNNTGSTATPIDLTSTQVTAILDTMVGDAGSGGTKGLVPAPASGDSLSGKFLKADGTWATPSGSGTSATYFRSYGTGATNGTAIQTITTTGTANWLTVTATAQRLILNGNTLQNGGFTNSAVDVTIPTTGIYTITYTVTTWVSGITNREIWVQLVKTTGGTPLAILCSAELNGGSNNNGEITITYTGAFTVGDIIDFRMQTVAGAPDVSINSYSLLINALAVPSAITQTFTVGDTKTSLKAADHDNWLLWTNGRILSRTTNATLWNFVNTNSLVATGLFGAGDGTTTFTLGNINGRAIGIVGSGTGLTARTLGASVGTETQTLTTANLPAHTHGLRGDSASGIGDDSSIDRVLRNTSGPVQDAAVGDTDSTGSNTAHNNMQPTIFLNFFVFGG